MATSTPKGPAERLESNPTFEYAAIGHALLERAWLITLCLIVGGFIAAGIIIQSEPRYESKLVLQIAQQEERVVPIEGVDAVDPRTLDYVQTLVEKLKARDVMVGIVHAAGLPQDMTFPFKRDRILTEAELAQALRSRIKVSTRKGTRLVDITVEDPSAERAQKIGRALVEQFIGISADSRMEATTSANKFLSDEVSRLQSMLANSELALQQYKDTNQAVSLEDKQNIVLDKLKDLNIKLTQAKSERLKKEADLAQVAQLGTDAKKLISIPSIASQRSVGDMMNQVSAAAAELANISERYRAKHPKFVQTQNRLDELKRRLDDAVLQAASGITLSYESSKEMEAKLTEALKEQEQASLDLEKKAIEYNKLAREVESNRALHDSVLKRMKETDVTKGLRSAPVHLVEAPSLPAHPTKPEKIKIILVSMGCSLMCGLATALGLYTLDQSIKTVAQAEAATGIPVIAAVPRHAKFKSEVASLVLCSDPNSSTAEAFRTMRSSLALMEKGTPGGVVLITSSSPSEGKSFTAANFAMACAQLGQRTLLIDADLRRPTVDGMFFESRRKHGLASLLAGTATYADSIHETAVKNLYVMPAGLDIANPAELLSSPELAKVMGYASTWFERVVLDTAPIHAVSDTFHLLEYCRLACLVVRAGSVPGGAIARAVTSMEQAGRRPVGVVLNMLPRQRGGGYYYYYSTGSYGDYTYGAHPESHKSKSGRVRSRSARSGARGKVISALMQQPALQVSPDISEEGAWDNGRGDTPEVASPAARSASATVTRAMGGQAVTIKPKERTEVHIQPVAKAPQAGPLPGATDPAPAVTPAHPHDATDDPPTTVTSRPKKQVFQVTEFRGDVAPYVRFRVASTEEDAPLSAEEEAAHEVNGQPVGQHGKAVNGCHHASNGNSVHMQERASASAEGRDVDGEKKESNGFNAA